MKYLCHSCLTIVDSDPCPLCGSEVEETCENNHACTCIEDVHSGIRYCPECGDPVCPCGSHDVLPITRVTGYMQDLTGMNEGKQQEIKDRKRYDIT